MKTKYALIALLAITFWGCDDNTAGLGLGMFPGSDQNINGKLSTFDVTTESVHAGKIYAMTNVGYVGKFTDETFGTYQAGFLAELNCPTGMTFPGVYDGTALDEKKKATRVMVDKEGLGDDVKPIYNTDNDSLSGAEALIRWNSKKYGFTGPNTFIPLLEDSALIIPLGRWIINTAAKACNRWITSIPDFVMHINLSFVQIVKSNIVKDVLELSLIHI